MAIYRDGIAGITRVTSNIPKPIRTLLFAAATICVLLALIQQQSPRAISQATSYATNKWQGKPTDQYWDRKGGKAGFFIPSTTTGTIWGSDAGRQFWEEYAHALIEGRPDFEKIRYRDDFKQWWFPPAFKATDLLTSREQRLNMTDEEIEEMTSKHKSMVEKVQSLASRLPYKPGTRGIVYSTNMVVMPFLTVSLRMLRKTGTTLPVEIWMWDRSGWNIDPYGLRLCKEIFEPLDATCRFVTDYLPDSRPPPFDKPTTKYQNKFDAILFSSFEQVAILDSDNVPLMPLDPVFTSEPFTTHNLLLWPDYWQNTASPYYYSITSTPEEHPQERASTEAGQIFVNKATHASALLLARYYALYPKHWIALLSQDPVDEGDKECFQHAARALNLPFYQIAEPPDRVGFRCNDKQTPLASGQHNPMDDYFLHTLGIRREKPDDMLNDGLAPRTMFIHHNLPKLDPAYLTPSPNFRDAIEGFQYCNGKLHRLWGPKSLTIIKYGWDIEEAVWHQLRFVACETEHLQSKWFAPDPARDNRTVTGVCERFSEWFDGVMREDAAPGSRGDVYDRKLTPAVYDRDGAFSLGWEAQKSGWSGVNWRWEIAAQAMGQKKESAR